MFARRALLAAAIFTAVPATVVAAPVVTVTAEAPVAVAAAQPVLDNPIDCGPGYRLIGATCVRTQFGPANPRPVSDDWWHSVVFGAFSAVMFVGSMVP